MLLEALLGSEISQIGFRQHNISPIVFVIHSVFRTSAFNNWRITYRLYNCTYTTFTHTHTTRTQLNTHVGPI